MNPLLEVTGLTKVFTLYHGQTKQITGCSAIDLYIREGEFIGITGKSGSGKSTILKSIYRSYLPTSGQIIYQSVQFGAIDLAKASDREIIAMRKKEIGYVSQFLHVMPRVTALEVVMNTLLETGQEEATAKTKVEEILTHFQLAPSLWDYFPRTFSGGEKLRLNLAQAMVKRPRLLLLDEPTASLDEASKESVKEMIVHLKAQGTSMIGIFHDLDFMEAVVDRHYHLENGKLSEIERAIRLKRS
ncbi:phosphonate C-P lyase system protein PhnL [Bacillaceae bacterium Marseille-Q3522]|nr:phosphonate C-P lyase system protein PhnL [Bacillaceae bacterium Marseille-Q3522]